MVIQGFIEGVQYVTSPDVLIWVMAGVIIGLIVGLVPGIGGLTVISIFLSFVFVLKPQQALPFIMALNSVLFTSGGITSILVGVPGEGPTVVTLFDGYPMTKKGEGGRAVGAALMASALGGVFSGFLALLLIPAVLPMVMAVQTGDMVFIILMGIAFIATLSRGSMVKGLISGGLGLIISLIGFQASSGMQRFTFNTDYLYGGLPLVAVIMGLFGMQETALMAIKGGRIAETVAEIKGLKDVWRGAKDVFHHWGLFLRSSIIGYIMGCIPGIGSTVANFVSYAQAKQTSKYPEKFGTGVIEGVIAPETTDNAKEGASLLITLALGVPSGAAMALLLSAIMLLGLPPGPQMLTEHLGLSLSLIYVVIVANVIGAFICFFAAPSLAKVAYLPSRILFPMILAFMFVGTFATNGTFYDLITLLIFFGVGIGLRRFGYNAPALILGFILGHLFENYFFLAKGLHGPFFFLRPISIVVIFIIIAVLSFEPIRRYLRSRRKVEAV